MGDEKLHTHALSYKNTSSDESTKEEKSKFKSNQALTLNIPRFISNLRYILYPASVATYGTKSHNSAVPTIVSSESSETTLSITNISKFKKLPVLTPREHGSNCILEISILEKHRKGCSNRKGESKGRHPLDDKVGSYDVINRVVYKTCDAKDADSPSIKNSAKGYKLNDPTFFGKDLKENRSRIEAIPILPESPSFSVMQASLLSERAHDRIFDKINDRKPAETVSIYIRMDKNEEVPRGFQKMHYKGDSCKLHDPNERSKQFLALQKVIDETQSGAAVFKSVKEFSPVVSQVFSTTTNQPVLPETLFAPGELNDSNDSIEIVEYKRTSNATKAQQTEGTRSVGCSEYAPCTNARRDSGKSSTVSIGERQGLFKRFIRKKSKDDRC